MLFYSLKEEKKKDKEKPVTYSVLLQGPKELLVP